MKPANRARRAPNHDGAAILAREPMRHGEICCPFCGSRPASEFSEIKELTDAPALEADAATWFAALYLRDAARDSIEEKTMVHRRGCGSVFRVSATDAKAQSRLTDVALEAATRQSPAPSRRNARRGPRRRLAS